MLPNMQPQAKTTPGKVTFNMGCRRSKRRNDKRHERGARQTLQASPETLANPCSEGKAHRLTQAGRSEL